MNLLRFLLNAPWRILLTASSAGLLSGFLSIALIAVINGVLHDSGSSGINLPVLFAALVLGKLIAHAFARTLLVRFTQHAIARLRRDLARLILGASLQQQERVGAAGLLTVLTDDVQAVSVALRDTPGLVVNLAIIIGAGAYLAWLSWSVLLALGAVASVGLLGYQPFLSSANRLLRRARSVTDELYRHLRAITDGRRELKLHRRRREAFLHQALDPTTEELRRLRVAAGQRFIAGQSWNQLLLYVLLGGLLFAAPQLVGMTQDTLTGYLLVIVYLIGPFASLNAVFPNLAPANVALQRIESMGFSLANETERIEERAAPAPSDWRHLLLKGVAYSYEHAPGDRHFRLGPIDLALRPGELVVLAGGNGSGKSTLAKLLCGLYAPNAGVIELDGQSVTDHNVEWYRSHFSAVFPNPYLFDTLLGLESQVGDARAQQLLVELGLDGEVRIDRDAVSTTRLSDGQRKRLALLIAYLEDRPIYVFDEWAADQDPEFKEAFYKRMLPELKSHGKTAVVISHDERYFGIADRVLRLEDGRLVAGDGVEAG